MEREGKANAISISNRNFRLSAVIKAVTSTSIVFSQHAKWSIIALWNEKQTNEFRASRNNQASIWIARHGNMELDRQNSGKIYRLVLNAKQTVLIHSVKVILPRHIWNNYVKKRKKPHQTEFKTGRKNYARPIQSSRRKSSLEIRQKRRSQ